MNIVNPPASIPHHPHPPSALFKKGEGGSQSKNLSVIKIGGSLLLRKRFTSLIRALSPYLKKNKSILVHGGGREITDYSMRLGLKTKFVNGRRSTDQKTMEIVKMVLCERVNPLLVNILKKNGINAIGSNDLKPELIQAKRIPALGCVGIPQKIKRAPILTLLQERFLPVFASVAANHDGRLLNVNADEMASAIAKTLRAERLILFTDVPGILDRQGRTIDQVVLSRGKKLIAEGIVSGGMIPKLNSALKAMCAGVKEIWILQGKLPLPSAKGTVLTRSSKNVRHPFA